MKLKQLARISILFFLISFISVSGIVYVGKNYESRYVNVNNETSNVNLGSYNLTCAWCTCSVNASNIQNEPWTAIITDVNATANTKAYPGTCTGSNVVQNTTTMGVQCVTVITTETGDVSSVTAGTGLIGGGTSGALTINVSANTCGTGNYSYYNSTGFNCRSDIDIDTDSWWSLSSDLYNCSGSLCLNMSKLNISMDARFNPLISERMINSSVYSLVAERMLNSTTYTLIGERVLNSSLSNYMTNASINALISERVLNATLNSYVTASAFDASQTAQNTTIASKIDQTYGNATYALIGSVGGNPFDQSLNTTDSPAFSELNIFSSNGANLTMTEEFDGDSLYYNSLNFYISDDDVADTILNAYHLVTYNVYLGNEDPEFSSVLLKSNGDPSVFRDGLTSSDWSNVSITESQISDFGSYGTSNLTLSEVSTYGNSTYGLLSVQNIIGNNISSLMIANVSANNRITSLNSTKVTIGTNADLYINQSRVINWFSGCPANSWITNITNGSSVCTALIPVSPYLSFSSNWNIALNETKLNSTVDNKLSSYVTSSTLSNYMQNSTTYAAISERALNSTVALKLENSSNANLSSVYVQGNITRVNCVIFSGGGKLCG